MVAHPRVNTLIPLPNEPACWQWIPVRSNSDERNPYYIFEEFQDGRCALCGVDMVIGRMAVDHDHATKLVRGFLCISCNIIETHHRRVETSCAVCHLLKKYRERPPAVILGLRVKYPLLSDEEKQRRYALEKERRRLPNIPRTW